MKFAEFTSLTPPGPGNALYLKLQQFLTSLLSSDLLSQTLILTHLDESFITSAGFLDQKTYNQKRSKAITQSIYEQ
jgi:hypothetical protein